MEPCNSLAALAMIRFTPSRFRITVVRMLTSILPEAPQPENGDLLFGAHLAPLPNYPILTDSSAQW